MASPFSSRAARNAQIASEQAIGGAFNANMRFIDDATQRARDALSGSAAGFDPISRVGMSGLNTYADALGLNGADAANRARGMFQTSPGYGFQMEQGLQALDRSATARGMGMSGNANLDTIRFAQGLANQEYGNWLNNVGSLRGLAALAPAAQQQQQMGLAGLEQGAGQQRVGAMDRYTQGMVQQQWNGANAQQQAANNTWQMAMQGGNLLGNLLGRLF